jgi:hypothetical protein
LHLSKGSIPFLLFVLSMRFAQKLRIWLLHFSFSYLPHKGQCFCTSHLKFAYLILNKVHSLDNILMIQSGTDAEFSDELLDVLFL